MNRECSRALRDAMANASRLFVLSSSRKSAPIYSSSRLRQEIAEIARHLNNGKFLWRFLKKITHSAELF